MNVYNLQTRRVKRREKQVHHMHMHGKEKVPHFYL